MRASVTISIPIQWQMQINQEELRRLLLAQERLEPWVLTIGAKHAEYLEFGTGPAQNREGEPVYRSDYKTDMEFYKAVYNNSEFYRSIYDWTRRKGAPDASAKDKYAIAYRIYQKLCREGMRARPFYRPAFYYMCEHLQEWFDKGYSIGDCVAEMERKLNELIEYNQNAPIGSEYMPFNGTLQESISTRALTPEEAERAKNPPTNPRPMSDDLWEDRTRRQGKELWRECYCATMPIQIRRFCLWMMRFTSQGRYIASL